MISNSTPSPQADLLLYDYRPQPRLAVPETQVTKPHVPVIDAHNHLSLLDINWMERPLSELLDWLDEADVRVFVDLDGGWGEELLNRHLDKFKSAAPERFIHYGGVDWGQWPRHGNRFGEWAAARLRDQVSRGAQGLKIWKNLGLRLRDHEDKLVSVDDPRLDPIWATAGELGIPVTIHIADPVAFFDPLDATNERWEELHAHPDWHFPSPPYPSFQSIVEGLARVVLRHPETLFIGAHVGCYAENLAWVGDLLDRAPNFNVDIAARIAELGRQPYTARRFFLKYSDRILFGTDLPPDPAMYRIHYRFLETDDEYFAYALEWPPPQGRWMIYGLYLPEDVLHKVYYQNAQRILGLT